MKMSVFFSHCSSQKQLIYTFFVACLHCIILLVNICSFINNIIRVTGSWNVNFKKNCNKKSWISAMPHKVSSPENSWGLCKFVLFRVWGAFCSLVFLNTHCTTLLWRVFYFLLCCFSATLLTDFIHSFCTKDKPLYILQAGLSLGSLLLSNALVSIVGTNF